MGDEWIRAVSLANVSELWPIDARVVAGSYAQMLRWLCGLSDVLGRASVTLEYSYLSINQEPLGMNRFGELSTNMQNRLSSGALSLIPIALQMLSTLTSGNEYVSALGTHVVARTTADTPDLLKFSITSYELENGHTCYCYPTASCQIPAALYYNVTKPVSDRYPVNSSTSIRGMRSDCYPFDGLLASSLECYFDAACLQLLVSTSAYFQPLNNQLTTRFPSKMAISSILSQSMVEQVSIEASIEDYFAQCNCAKCTYKDTYRNNWAGIASVAIGMIGGVNTALCVMIPTFVGLMYKLLISKCKRSAPTVSKSVPKLTDRIRNWIKETLRTACKMVKTFNMFNSHSDDPVQTRREIQATRLYLVLVITAFVILALLNTLVKKTNRYTVSYQSYEQFIALQEKYGNTLRCDCFETNYQYWHVTNIIVKYHPICSSEFVSASFIDQLFRIQSTPTYPRDFVTMSGMYFRAIALYCTWIFRVVEYRRIDALKRDFDYTYLIDSDEFNRTTKRMLDNFQSAALQYVNGYVAELLELLINTHSLSASQTSSILPITSNGSILVQPVDLDNCSCLLHPRNCSTEAGFYVHESNNHSFTRMTTLMGVRIGCSSFHSMFHSSLACWYSSKCYGQVTAYWEERLSTFSIRPSLLNPTDLHHFNMNDTLKTIIEQGMINEVRTEPTFSDYLKHCIPKSCTYSIIERSSIILIFINLFATWSGLNVAMKLLSPALVYMIYWCLQHRQGMFLERSFMMNNC